MIHLIGFNSFILVVLLVDCGTKGSWEAFLDLVLGNLMTKPR